jgi:hypothetical protein
MPIEILRSKEAPPRLYFAYCHSCDDINEENGDYQDGPLQLSGWGASLEEAKNQAQRHMQLFSSDHKITIE